MIEVKEFIKTKTPLSLPLEHQYNLQRLFYCLSFLRILFDRPMVITSGYRTLEEHYLIYQKINAERKQRGEPPRSIPYKSHHLLGAAADVFDPEGKLKEWVVKNIKVCEDLNIYFERFEYTKNWVHVSIYPPKSNERFFIP